MIFTTILHDVRRQFELNLSDYCVVEAVFFRMNDPQTKMLGWCTISRQTLADELDLSRQTVITILKKLKEKGLVEENEMSFLKTTKTWFEAVNRCKETLHPVKKPYSKETLQGVNKLDSSCKETLQGGVKFLYTPPNISNILNNKIIVDDEKENFDLENFESEIKKTPADFDREKLKELLADSPIVEAVVDLPVVNFQKHLLGMESALMLFRAGSKKTDVESYRKAVEVFLIQNVDDGKVWKNEIECGRHFRNWVPFYIESQLSGSSQNTKFRTNATSSRNFTTNQSRPNSTAFIDPNVVY